MIKIKNLTTGEVKNVYNTEIVNGFVKSNLDKPLGKRFVNSWKGILTETIGEDGGQLFVLSEDWKVITGKERKPRKQRTPKEKPVPTTTDEPKDVPEVVEVETMHEDVPMPKDTTTDEDLTNEQALIAALKNLRGGAVDMAKVREIVREEFSKLAAENPIKASKVLKVAKVDTKNLYCDDFDDIVNDVKNGWYPYLWGAAGCGKSHTCEQVADALGLEYYSQNMLNFAHEIAGYGNAAGEFVETPFFRAFSKGGLFHLDEADRSQIEGLVTLNQALANGIFNFPVIGNVKAHPNFRFICSGNTQMNGADEMYTSGQQQDASFKRRIVFYEMHYDRRIELPIMAQGDEVLVNFVEDVRRAIKRTGTLHFVSYTETKYMKEHEDKKEKALIRSTFKSLDIDIIRQIYGELTDKSNVWAVALNNVINNYE